MHPVFTLPWLLQERIIGTSLRGNVRKGITRIVFWFLLIINLFLRNIFSLKKLWRHWYPSFGILVMSALGFKARVDPSLACYIAFMQWTPQIHLWCDTCWPHDCQHGSRAFLIQYLYMYTEALVGLHIIYGPILDMIFLVYYSFINFKNSIFYSESRNLCSEQINSRNLLLLSERPAKVKAYWRFTKTLLVKVIGFHTVLFGTWSHNLTYFYGLKMLVSSLDILNIVTTFFLFGTLM